MSTPTENHGDRRPLALILLAATIVVASAGLGAAVNSVNGAVSPGYFRQVLGWDDVTDVWRASIAQGIFEGLLFGLFFSLIFTLVVGLVSKVRCPYGHGLGYVLGIAACAAACWAVGGLTAIGLAALSPEFFRHNFLGVPEATGAMLRYAWVGGSIWGVEIGGFASVIFGSVVFWAKWRQADRRKRA